LAVSFRYTVSPLTTMKTWVFRPNAPDHTDSDDIRSAALGSVLAGNFHQVVRSKKASVCWEARNSLESDHAQPSVLNQVFS
jgi:hypothetical protein